MLEGWTLRADNLLLALSLEGVTLSLQYLDGEKISEP